MWKQPSTGELVNKIHNMHAVEYYSVMKNSEVLICYDEDRPQKCDAK